MIFDHLEPRILFSLRTPAAYGAAADTACDGNKCSSTFDPDDFYDATTFFMQQLQPLVANVKLHRPLDSHSPLSRELMLSHSSRGRWFGGGIPQMALNMSMKSMDTQNIMMTPMSISNMKNIKNIAMNNTTTAQTPRKQHG